MQPEREHFDVLQSPKVQIPPTIPQTCTTVSSTQPVIKCECTIHHSNLRATAPSFSSGSLVPFVMDISLPNNETDIYTSVHNVIQQTKSHVTGCFAVKTAPLSPKDMFFQLESLGTFIEPRCGGCKCASCPIPGSKYSFAEQKEFDAIRNSLYYDSTAKCCT